MSLSLRPRHPDAVNPSTTLPGGALRGSSGRAGAGVFPHCTPTAAGSGGVGLRHPLRSFPNLSGGGLRPAEGQLRSAPSSAARLANPPHRRCTGTGAPAPAAASCGSRPHRNPPGTRVGFNPPAGPFGGGSVAVAVLVGGGRAASLRRTKAGQLRGFSSASGGRFTQSGAGSAAAAFAAAQRPRQRRRRRASARPTPPQPPSAAPPQLPPGLWLPEAALARLLSTGLAQLPSPDAPPFSNPATPLALPATLLRRLLKALLRRLEGSGLDLVGLPPAGFRGRWLRRLVARLKRGGGDAATLTTPELLLLGGLLAALLSLLGHPHPRLPGGPSGENTNLGRSLELLDRSFRLRPGWYLRLELEPLLSAGVSSASPAPGPFDPSPPWLPALERRFAEAGATPPLLAVLRLLQRRGLRPHYPSEALPLESCGGYATPPPLAPLGEGLLGLLLAPLDHWGQRRQREEWRGEKRRQNPAYSRLLYLRRRLREEQWPQLPPASATWRPRPGEVGLDQQQLQQLLRSTPSRDPRDANFRRHQYLRHGSLLLLGVAAPPDQARLWGRQLVEQLAALGLPGLRPPRPRSSSLPLLFRGFRLRCAGLRSRSPSKGQPCSGYTPRSSPRLSLKLPTADLCARLGRSGLLQWGGEGLHPADAALGRLPHG